MDNDWFKWLVVLLLLVEVALTAVIAMWAAQRAAYDKRRGATGNSRGTGTTGTYSP